MADPIGTWAEASKELDGIVASFDEGEVTVDDLIAKLARASEIIEALEERLTVTRAKVEELAPRLARGAADTE